jgi:hypothetical protein
VPKGSLIRRFTPVIASTIYLTGMLVLCGALREVSAQQKTSSEMIERVSFHWSHSSGLSTFSLFRQHDANGNTSDRLVIDSSGMKRWRFVSQEGGWATLSEAGFPGGWR